MLSRFWNSCLTLATWCLIAAGATPLFAQTDWSVPRAQPFFDVPWQSRYNPCTDPGPVWSCDPTMQMQGPNGEMLDACDECNECGNGAAGMPACGALAHRRCGWYASAEFIPLFYDNYSLNNFGAQNGTVVLNDADFNTDFNAGARFKLGRALTDCISIEGGFQGFYDYNDTAAVRDQTANALGGTGNLQSPFTLGLAQQGGVDFNNFISVAMRNRYNTAELNFLYRSDNPPGIWDTYFLIGARFAEVDEQFSYFSRSNVPGPGGSTNNVLVDTKNNMWGAQLGFGVNALITRKAWIEFSAKGAMLGNAASMTSTYTNTNANAVTTTVNGAAQRDRTSFLGEMLLVGNYQVTPGFTFRAGYQATWVTGVALGADNFERDLPLLQLGPTAIDHAGQIVYHGPVLGFELSR